MARTTEQHTLEIALLGRLEVRRGGEAVPLPASKKSRALLAYLIATTRPHPRERLCELLWDAPDDPRASLRWSLAKLRPLIDDERQRRLVCDREVIAFDASGVRVDLFELRTALAGGAAVASVEVLRKATALFRGEFLEGLDLTGCYRYHEWWSNERDKARAQRAAVLTELIGRLRDTPDEALSCAQQLLCLDPLAESSHIVLMRLLADLGRPREALAQYERCKRVLRNELGAEPSAALQLARIAITERPNTTVLTASFRNETATPHDSAADDSAEAAPFAGQPRERAEAAPIAGRARERAAIERMVSATSRGAEHGLLHFVGEPGIGKTRLLEEVARALRRAGGVVLTGRAFEAEAVRPYGPWIDALRSVALPEIAGQLRTDLVPLMPELGAPSNVASDRGRLLDAVTTLLTLVRPGAPVAVILDDLQWFEDGSAALLHYAVRALARSQVLFACAARPAELVDNVAMGRVLRSLARQGLLTEMPLDVLDLASTVELIRPFGGNAEGLRVFTESGGNPFFALEIAGALARGEETLSQDLEQLIRERFDRLTAPSTVLLAWAAAFGRSFALERAMEAGPLPADELVSAIEELSRRGILRRLPSADGTTAYDFAHDIIRQTAYRQTSEARNRLLHRSIAHALARLDDASGALAGDVAHHAALGGDDELCVRACLSAGQRCVRMFANSEAQTLAERAKQRLAGLAPSLRITMGIELLRLRVEAGGSGARAHELQDELSRTIFEAQSAGLAREAAVGWELLSITQHRTGNVGETKRSLEASERVSREADPDDKARAIARAGRCLVQIEQDLPRAKTLLAEASALCAHMSLSPVDLPLGLGMLRYHEGEFAQSEQLLDSAWSVASARREHWLAFEALSQLIMMLLERDRAAAALSRCAELRPLAAKLGEGSELPFATTLEALARLHLGEEGALASADAALGQLRKIDSKGQLAYAQNCLAEWEMGRGSTAATERRAREALAVGQAVGRATGVARSRLILARLAEQAGDDASARVHLEALREDMTRPYGVAASTRWALVALGERLGVRFSAAESNGRFHAPPPSSPSDAG